MASILLINVIYIVFSESLLEFGTEWKICIFLFLPEIAKQCFSSLLYGPLMSHLSPL